MNYRGSGVFNAQNFPRQIDETETLALLLWIETKFESLIKLKRIIDDEAADIYLSRLGSYLLIWVKVINRFQCHLIELF